MKKSYLILGALVLALAGCGDKDLQSLYNDEKLLEEKASACRNKKNKSESERKECAIYGTLSFALPTTAIANVRTLVADYSNYYKSKKQVPTFEKAQEIAYVDLNVITPTTATFNFYRDKETNLFLQCIKIELLTDEKAIKFSLNKEAKFEGKDIYEEICKGIDNLPGLRDNIFNKTFSLKQ